MKILISFYKYKLILIYILAILLRYLEEEINLYFNFISMVYKNLNLLNVCNKSFLVIKWFAT